MSAHKRVRKSLSTAEGVYEKSVIEAEKLTRKKCDEMIECAKCEVEALRSEVKAEIAAWESEKARLAHTQQFEHLIKLDVGGVKHTTTLTTLCRFPDTMIGAMFSGRHALPLNEEGYHFIDRDGTHFRHILNYLRSPETFDTHIFDGGSRGPSRFGFPNFTENVEKLGGTVTADQPQPKSICRNCNKPSV